MEKPIVLNPVGAVGNAGRLLIHKRYRDGLKGAEKFSHLIVLWWADGADRRSDREALIESEPYRGGPEALGVFATRSPHRPNPIGVSVVEVLGLDAQHGSIDVAFIDATDGTPIVDLKPYVPSLDRVEAPAVADWCLGWPRNVETSGDFDWSQVF